jgi:hypothetical protein
MEAEREPGTLIDGRYRVVRDDDEGVYAVDLRTLRCSVTRGSSWM